MDVLIVLFIILVLGLVSLGKLAFMLGLVSMGINALYKLSEGSSCSSHIPPEDGEDRMYSKMPADLRDLPVTKMTPEQFRRYLDFLVNYKG